MKLFVSLFSVFSVMVLFFAQSLASMTADVVGKGMPYEHLIVWTVIGYVLIIVSIVVSVVTRFKHDEDDSFWALYWFVSFVGYATFIGWSIFVLAMLAG